jgi:hypothetical protein
MNPGISDQAVFSLPSLIGSIEGMEFEQLGAAVLLTGTHPHFFIILFIAFFNLRAML